MRPLRDFVLMCCTILVTSHFALGCVYSREQQREPSSTKPTPSTFSWYQGNMEDALTQARREGTPVFLYWGAEWCPACNEITSQVFVKQRFIELMKSYIPVYLNGDTQEAQIWGEKLNAFYYPTIMVLNPEGIEVMRINGGVNMEEFELSLGTTRSGSGSIKHTLDLALNGKANQEHWQMLAFLGWDQVPHIGLSPMELLQAQYTLVENVPADLKRERANLTASLLMGAATLKNPAAKGLKAAIKQDASRYLGYLFEDKSTITTVRNVLNNGSRAILGWLYSNHDSDGYQKARTTWLKAVNWIEKQDRFSVDTRLWAVFPMVDLYRLEHGDKQKLDPAIVSMVEQAVKCADQRASHPYQRQAVIARAALLLVQVGKHVKARTLLHRELKTSDMPWFYQAIFAKLEQMLGQNQQALDWSRKARVSAQSQAIRLRLTVNDLVLNTQVKAEDQDSRILALLEEFYRIITQLKDGFSGGNAYRALQVAKSVKPWMIHEAFRSLVASYSQRCPEFGAQGQNKCEEHFKELL